MKNIIGRLQHELEQAVGQRESLMLRIADLEKQTVSLRASIAPVNGLVSELTEALAVLTREAKP